MVSTLPRPSIYKNIKEITKIKISNNKKDFFMYFFYILVFCSRRGLNPPRNVTGVMFCFFEASVTRSLCFLVELSRPYIFSYFCFLCYEGALYAFMTLFHAVEIFVLTTRFCVNVARYTIFPLILTKINSQVQENLLKLSS